MLNHSIAQLLFIHTDQFKAFLGIFALSDLDMSHFLNYLEDIAVVTFSFRTRSVAAAHVGSCSSSYFLLLSRLRVEGMCGVVGFSTGLDGFSSGTEVDVEDIESRPVRIQKSVSEMLICASDITDMVLLFSN